MAVIKSTGSPEVSVPGRQKVINADVVEASQEAKRIVEDAKRMADSIKEDANREKHRIFAEAKEMGHEAGLAEMSTEIAKAKMQAGEILKASEKDIVELALKIAEKIIGRDLEREPAVISDICATAIENVRNAKQLVLRVNPRDGATLRENRKALMEMVGRLVDIAFKDDGDVAPGGCIIQTEFGTIDAQLETQFLMLKNVLLADSAKKEGPA
jgi:type III secretion protein L